MARQHRIVLVSYGGVPAKRYVMYRLDSQKDFTDSLKCCFPFEFTVTPYVTKRISPCMGDRKIISSERILDFLLRQDFLPYILLVLMQYILFLAHM